MKKIKQLLVLLVLVFSTATYAQVSVDWQANIDSTNIFSSPRAVDLTNDGVLDIVLGGGLENFARTQAISAIDGATGDIIWQVGARNQIFGSATFYDITGDNIPDVFIGGRTAELIAIDGSNGAVIWEFYPQGDTMDPVDDDLFQFYTSQIVPDQNGDGYSDLLVANGGYPAAGPLDPDRPPNYIMVISALDGEELAKAMVPDEKETYMSPIVNDLDGDGEMDVLFGTGGETIGGSLWRATLSEVMSNDLSNAIELMSGANKGFLGPPSIADFNLDDVMDIVVHSYDGRIAAFDGATNEQLWLYEFPGTESYATPAIGRFTDDLIPDIITTAAVGLAPSFDSFKMILIDGATGELVFQESRDGWSLITPVAVDFDGDGFDEGIFCSNSSFTAGPPFQHQVLLIDFNDDTITTLVDFLDGTNLAITPWVGDLENDGALDLVYAHHLSPSTPKPSDGFTVKRLNLDTDTPDNIAFGAYLGTNYDGTYDNPLEACAAFSMEETHADASCFGVANGNYTISVTGGTPPYIYTRNGVDTPPITSTGLTAQNQVAGEYNVICTDVNGCTTEVTVIIESPAEIEVVIDSLLASSGSVADASISLDVSGGSEEFNYTWNHDAALNTPNITNLINGWYCVTITDENTLCEVTECIDLFPVGINDLAAEVGINIYPNPASEVLNIDLDNLPINTSETVRVSIYNTLGEQIKTQVVQSTNTSLLLSHFQSGLYYVQIEAGTQQFTKKVVVH